MHLPKLTIGLPVYNGGLYITRALNALTAQDFTDWVVVVADNCSSDNTINIVNDFCIRDSRIRLVQHDKNIGAVNNFLFLTKEVSTPFFMWAAADDEWTPNYVSECLAVLRDNSEIGFVGGNVVNIDVGNHVLRSYQSFSAFDSTKAHNALKNFLWAREAEGKANIIYSVYRTALVQSICQIPDIFKGWGSDMAFVAAALARTSYQQAENAFLLKRVISESDINTAIALNSGYYSAIQFQGHFPPTHYQEYTDAISRGMPTLRLRFLAKWIMLRRHLSLYLKRKLNLSK